MKKKTIFWKIIYNRRFEDSLVHFFSDKDKQREKQKSFISNINNDKPKNQEYLTSPQNIIYKSTNFNLYSPTEMNGILSYIYLQSNRQLNLKELEFFFSGGKYTPSFDKIDDKVYKNKNLYNILNIFDLGNPRTQYQINSFNHAYFGVTFKRIKVFPKAYKIQSGISQNTNGSLISYVFEALDEDSNEWVTLDERVNCSGLIHDGSQQTYYVKVVLKSFSSFRIRQTDLSSNDLWGFAISGFDIIGDVSYKDECIFDITNDDAPLFENDSEINFFDRNNSFGVENFDTYDELPSLNDKDITSF